MSDRSQRLEVGGQNPGYRDSAAHNMKHIDPRNYLSEIQMFCTNDPDLIETISDRILKVIRRVQTDAEQKLSIFTQDRSNSLMREMIVHAKENTLSRREQVAMAIGNAFIAAGNEGVPPEEWFRRADLFLEASQKGGEA